MALTSRSSRLCLWDTCSYVRRFVDQTVDEAIAQDIRHRRFLLCSVVAMELYAGSRGLDSKRALDALVRSLDSLDLLVTPKFADHQAVGVALGRYARARGSVDSRAHFRDALIAACAARRGAVVVTENVRDFGRWSRWPAAAPGLRVVRPDEA